MFESEIESARIHLQDQLATLEPYVYLRDILNHPELESAYKHYFAAEVEWWIHEEKNLREANSRFDMQDSQIQVLFNTLDKYYRNVARFDRDELDSSVDGAVKARVNYLCRPRTALKWFVFRGEPTKPIQEILLRMNFFEEYGYLRKGFSDWVDQRKTDRSSADILSVVEFERVIERIDNDVILDLSPKEFVALIDPIFSFFQLPQSKIPRGTLPIEALIIFLDDKGIVPIAQELENLLYHEGLRYIDKVRFLAVVDQIIREIEAKEESAEDNTLPLAFGDEHSMQPEKPGPEEEIPGLPEENIPEEPAPEPEPETKPSEPETGTPLTEEPPAPEPEEEPTPVPAEEPGELPEDPPAEAVADSKAEAIAEIDYDPDFLEDIHAFETNGTVSPEDGEIEPETFTDDFSEENFPQPGPEEEEEIFSLADDVPAEREDLLTIDSTESSPAAPIKVRIFDDVREEAKFIARLFGHNEEEFDNFVTKIVHHTKWKETARELDILFITNNIDPQSDIAREFREVLQKRYEV